MIVFESRRSRTLVGRVEAGESVEAALLRVAREREVTTGWVSATGSLRSATLAFTELDAGEEGEARRFEGGLELLQLSGNLSSSEGDLVLEARAHLARATDNGVQVLGGRLVDAVAHAVEFRVECYDDLGLRREADDATGLRLWRGDRLDTRAAPPRPSAPRDERPGVSWAAAAQASSERVAPPSVERRRAAGPSGALPFVPDPIPSRKKADDDLDVHSPERGDWVDHKQFGLCRVENLAEDGGLLIRLETGRRKLIKLDFLDVLPPREDGNKKIYPLRPKRR
jgi:predicted DNA-binding protein with PD1-like motif